MPNDEPSGPLSRLLSVRTVCRLLDRERKWVLARCRAGAWRARKVGNAWRIPERELTRWLEDLERAKRPGTA